MMRSILLPRRKPFKNAASALIVEVRTLEYTNGDRYEVRAACSNDLRYEVLTPFSQLGNVEETNSLDFTQGEVLDTLRHGQGKHTCSNGDTYDGAWQYDKRHGRGTATFARGVCYEGQWKEDLAHG